MSSPVASSTIPAPAPSFRRLIFESPDLKSNFLNVGHVLVIVKYPAVSEVEPVVGVGLHGHAQRVVVPAAGELPVLHTVIVLHVDVMDPVELIFRAE